MISDIYVCQDIHNFPRLREVKEDSLDSSPLNSGPGIYCWRVGGQLIYYLPYFISLNVKTVIVIKNRKKKKERLPLCRQRQLSKTSAL